MIRLVFLLAAQTYSHGDPTNDEQVILEMINRARRNPVAEGNRLSINILEGLSAPDQALVTHKPPLAFNSDLIDAARHHNDDMYTQDYFDHYFPAGTIPPASTSTPQIRMTAEGYVFNAPYRLGENIATGDPYTAAGLEDLLMVDAGIAGRGHRKNLLDIYASAPYREVGIGFADKGASKTNILRFIVTQDFARSTGSGPFLVGVVYDDANHNGQYDAGEGISGASITIGGSTWNATTSTSGGYAVPVATSGTITITASKGGWSSSIVRKATLSGENVKMDFILDDLVDTDGDGIPDYWEQAHGLNKNNNGDAVGAPNDPDGDGADNLTEYLFNSDPHQTSSTPADPDGAAPPPTPPTSGGGGGGKGGGCGLTGLEAAIALGLAAAIRRRRAA